MAPTDTAETASTLTTMRPLDRERRKRTLLAYWARTLVGFDSKPFKSCTSTAASRSQIDGLRLQRKDDDPQALWNCKEAMAMASPNRPTICLAMIVRNEAAVIARCIESARPWIDTWVICDTGSTDDTTERLRERLADLPGQLHERAWRNFGHNRSELLQLARSHGDYLLLLDADMTLDGDPAILNDIGDADAYLVRVTGEPEYWMPYLVRSTLPWRYEGVTHEYLTVDRPYRQERLPGLAVIHLADGGSRGDKFERDLALLSRQVRERPDDARAVFYLAQTYRDIGQIDEAVRWYERRAAMGGWAEEVFYSLYQQGDLLARRSWAEAVPVLLAAYNHRPSRAEPLYALAAGYRERGAYASAHLFASRGLAIGVPDDLLFVSRWIYDWGLVFEYSVAAYWVGDIRAAYEATQALAVRNDVPEPWRSHVKKNLEICRNAASVLDS